ncbi:unnamed protein product [Urochloa decumbens]|uniref:AAA+ ATPase domain-containing protein n=1 Tax=Urochloa decumbens TaxID=240449 RepID=A0ABC9H2A1_9POAL
MPNSGTPGDTPTILTKWTWMDAVTLSLLTCLFGLLFPNLVNLQQQIFGRRVHRRVRWLASIVDPDLSVTIRELDGPAHMKRSSDAYEDVKAYLGARCSRKARHLLGEAARNAADKLELSMRNGEEVADEIKGGTATVWWSLHFIPRSTERDEEGYQYTLHYQECHRDDVLCKYLPDVRRKGRHILDTDRQRKIMTNISGWGPSDGWSRMLFKHPKTFETLAMDPSTKQEIIDDLKMFQKGRKYYAKLGKPWKRGYLLYGPPGTGKSTMVAAMANLLKYDVYDIELTSVKSNTELRKLLIGIKNKSITVIEDIDCSLDLTGARKDGDDNDDDDGTIAPEAAARVAQDQDKVTSSRSQVTLSGLLNFIDGLWSACGEERIIVFTTNHIDKLDPALIRRGRMDMHIEMSYCCFEAFKFLAKLYLNKDSHRLFGAVEKLLREVEMTPADVAENLTLRSDDDDAESCLQRLVGELKKRRTTGGKANRATIRSNNAARAVPAGATEDGRRRSPRIRARTPIAPY